MNTHRRLHEIGFAALGTLTLAASLCATGAARAQTATAEIGVRDTLKRYSAALESLDANAVKKVQPSVPADNLAKAFKDMRELKVEIDSVQVLSADGTIARVSCRVMQTLTPRRCRWGFSSVPAGMWASSTRTNGLSSTSV